MEYTKELCACGFPQSYPLPHEHDRTERERQIIKHYEDTTKDLYEALKDAQSYIARNEVAKNPLPDRTALEIKIIEAIARIEGLDIKK